MLPHGNISCHTALSITELLTSKGIPVVLQTLYSPDLSSCDFSLFPKLKNVLKRRHFGTLEDIQKSVTDMLKTSSAATNNGNNVSIGV
ncbi:DDE_3 domain-containing protein [Trichonephila clavipes]|nr:DDE_3 domain-containing protein [Trichonephila clavipes]